MQAKEFFNNKNVLNTILNKYNFSKETKLTGGILINGERSYKLWSADENESFKMLPYEVGSITKTFTGTLMARAIYEGKANLNDSISKYIKELPSDKFYPTIKQVVTHSAGLPEGVDIDEDEEKWENYNFQNTYHWDDLINQLKELNFEDKPYEPLYSNIGAGVCGLILSRIYGKSYEELIKEFADELQLHDTHIFDSKNDIGLCGVNSKGEKSPNWTWESSCAIMPAGAIISNAQDLLTYAENIINNTKPYFASSVTPLSLLEKGEPDIEIGYFWMKIDGCNVLFHNGFTACFTTALAIDIENKTALCLLSNQDRYDGGWSIIDLLSDLKENRL